MKSIQPYQQYKPSNIDWLGEIPEHWEEVKGKWVWKKEKRPVRKEDEVVTAFRDGEVTLRKNRREEGFTVSLQEIGYQGIRKGDLVIHGMDAFAGAIGVSDSDGKSSPVYSACTSVKDADPYFFSYLLKEMSRRGWIECLAKGIRERSTEFRFSEFASLIYPLPTSSEQQAITAFLDHKCAQIDLFIEKKYQLIELLKEQKQAIINQAVTKGINPEVGLKDSDVEWLGEIPVHWEVKKLKFVTSRLSRGTTPDYIESSPFKVINQATFSRGFFDTSSIRFHKANSIYGLKGQVRKGDILLASTGGGVLGKCFFYDLPNEDFIADSHVTIVRTKDEILISRFLYLFLSINFNLIEGYLGQGATNQTELQSGWLGGLLVAFPDKYEQERIVSYLDREVFKIDQAISRIEKEIALTKEYKQSLISEAVTGKMDVRSRKLSASELPELNNEQDLVVAPELLESYTSHSGDPEIQ